MKFVFIAKHRNIWPVAWLCNAMGVSRSGFHAWLNRSPSARSRGDEAVSRQVKASFVARDRTYGARRVWRDVLADGVECGLHRIERLMRLQALRARPRRRRLPKDEGDRQVATVASNVLDRQFVAERPNQKWIADFTYIWTAEGWLYVSAVIDLFSRRVVGWVDERQHDGPIGCRRPADGRLAAGQAQRVIAPLRSGQPGRIQTVVATLGVWRLR
ncbi:hypothetical protein ACVW0I_001595 [Bradyrhizobium sp. LM6.11]